jgi:hypothetical protein
VALMCQDERVAAAMYAAGSPCPRALYAEVAEPSPDPGPPLELVRRNGVD